MAAISRHIFIFITCFSLTASHALAEPNGFPADIPAPEAVNAFREFWQTFEQYEEKLLTTGEKKFRSSWEEVRKAYSKEHAALSKKQLEQLQQAAEKYRTHLKQHAQSENRPFVMLNLAQILAIIGDHQAREEAAAGTFTRLEALAMLQEIDTRYPDFVYREQTHYLRAVLLESLDRVDDAMEAWRILAAQAQSTIYGLHARIAFGDHLFRRDRAAEAMTAYQKALDLLPKISVKDSDYERLRINYRLAWSAYRATDLATVIKAGSEILQPGHYIKSVDQRRKVEADAIDLMGDALYEKNSLNFTRETLKKRQLLEFAPAIGLRTLKHLVTKGNNNDAAALGDFLAQEFPLSREAPTILELSADAQKKAGRGQRYLDTLEKLALLLPPQSLWRARFKDDPEAIKTMEEKARLAAKTAAEEHYDHGLASGSSKSFMAAASLYETLLEKAENDSESNDWRLRRAHCFYFAGRHEEASRLYADLKTNYKVSSDILQIAAYQQVLANERQWREVFAKAVEKNDDPLKNEASTKALKDLEKSIDEFASRFPNQTRSVDLLLVGGSANRDMERHDDAARYWQRALVSQPNPSQRGVAIRGLLFTSMKTRSAGEVAEIARRFLRLEDWNALGLNLGNELKGVLSAAALDEAQRLSDKGQALEAGTLLTSIAGEFADIPARERMYRDGGYMLAIGGDWAGAQKASENYLNTPLKQYRADMTYLLARAHEYQLRLHDAASTYKELGEKFPEHSRSLTSLERAERLAIAEGDFILAAHAAALQAERAKDAEARFVAYGRAAEYLEKAEAPTEALAIAEKRLRSSRDNGERLKSQVLVARLNYQLGKEQQALDQLVILSKQVEREKHRLKREHYLAVSGEVHFLLGEEARRKFEDFKLGERAGNLANNIDTKTRYFDELASSYDKVIANNDAEWAPRARFQLAISAETFAEEIASLATKNEQGQSLRARSRYQSTIDRLNRLAKKYYSNNVLVARQDPSRYQRNEWVRKSSLRLTGKNSDEQDERRVERLPAAIPTALPSQWSL